jgi:hypothetical protein
MIDPNELLEEVKTNKISVRARGGRLNPYTPYVDTIRYMRAQKHMSYSQIYRFLDSKGVKGSYQGLRNFCRSTFKKR